MSIATLRKQIVLRRSLPPPRERRELRQAAGLSRQELAVALGVAYSTVYGWETGAHLPRRRHLEPYLEVLAVLRDQAGALGDAE
jgi:DNA-binding transcriptional regulator YiaG